MTARKIIADAVELAPALEWALGNYPNLVLRPSFMFRMMKMFGAIYDDENGEGWSVPIIGGPSSQQIEHSLFAASPQYREPLTFKVSVAEGSLDICVLIDCVDRSFYGAGTTPLWLLGGELAYTANKRCSPEDALVLITGYEPRQRSGNIILTPYVTALVENGRGSI
ncbi:hypothetical protein KKD81_00265 [Patescibacteria group bacterium]|nr:hypothetical protein [Patescibacteria group bacterium]MBU2159228.1 hypothetical protein [Patescibacteria group bacterium]MBU2220353.1 hypothetical protein [Patescibacteria group bacterium]